MSSAEGSESTAATISTPPTAGPLDDFAPAPKVTAARNEAIDVIRLLAAAGIVFVHAAKDPLLVPWGHALRFAVPFYLFASFYFQSLSFARRTDRTLGQYIFSRFKRLYLPFLAWSVIYLIARDVRRVKLLHLDAVHIEPGLLWKGVEYHLWFLPFLLAGSIFLAAAHWMLLKRRPSWRWPLISIALAAGLYFATAPMPAGWDEKFPSSTYAYVQFWRSLPAACWGLAFAWFMTAGPVVYRVGASLGLTGVAMALACSVSQAFHGIQLIPRALSGLGAILVALAPWKSPGGSLLARLGRQSYGVYLCHVLVVEVSRVGLTHAHIPAGVPYELSLFVVGFAASLAVVLTLAQSRWTAWLNG